MARRRRQPSNDDLRRQIAQAQAQARDREAAAPAAAGAAEADAWSALPPLERLAYMRRVQQELESDIRAEVIEAHQAGHSWHAIGGAFGITGEGARRRWGV